MPNRINNQVKFQFTQLLSLEKTHNYDKINDNFEPVKTLF